MTAIDRWAGADDAAEEGGAVEAFVAKLHEEGLEAGRRDAERLLEEARAEAREIERRARARAEELVSAAKATVEEETARGRAELKLAVRDALLDLRSSLAATLSAILARAAGRELEDPAVVVRLLTQVMKAYASAEADRRPVEVRIPASLRDDVESWWLAELSEALRDGATLAVTPSLRAGFEYRIDGGTVEVTAEAAVERLVELLSPRLRAIVAEVAGDLGGEPAPLAMVGAAGSPGD